MDELELRIIELEQGLEYAEKALERADANYCTGSITFRTYLNYRERVEEIEAEIKEMNKK